MKYFLSPKTKVLLKNKITRHRILSSEEVLGIKREELAKKKEKKKKAEEHKVELLEKNKKKTRTRNLTTKEL